MSSLLESKVGSIRDQLSPLKETALIDPAFGTDVYIDPGVLDISGITNLKFAWNIAASEHGRGERGIIKTDAGTGTQCFIYIRQITGVLQCLPCGNHR